MKLPDGRERGMGWNGMEWGQLQLSLQNLVLAIVVGRHDPFHD